VSKNLLIRCPFCGTLLIEAEPVHRENDGTISVHVPVETLTEMFSTVVQHVVETHTDGFKAGTDIQPEALLSALLGSLGRVQSLSDVLAKLENFQRDN
jgi:hypothetical protein